ncbi:MAG: hypothetical protein NTU45_14875 [Planctomycetota bacterium]|nr:hypothetical protein [Planctomycetota bacterium]
MPQFPSGRRMAVGRMHILKPGTQWFACPEGHFWYQTPDLAINAPPFQRDQTVICDFVHAPVPRSVEEMARYINIIEVFSDERIQITGLQLDCAKRPPDWSEADWAAFKEWRDSESIRAFVKESIEMCREQAEANRSSPGFVKLEQASVARDRRREAALGQIMQFGGELARFDGELGDGFEEHEREKAARIFVRLLEIERSLSALLDDPATSFAEGWHAYGLATRLLRKPDAAERAFLESIRLAPFDQSSWLELTRIRGERGNFTGSEVAARRAVELDEKSAPAWSNLAMSLLLLDRRDEARDAAARGLAIDEADPVARNVLGLLERGVGPM